MWYSFEIFIRPEGNASHVLWDILRVYGQFPQIGLQDNLVYDVVPTIQSATKDVIVNATRFTADCGLVPDTIQLDFVRDGGTTNQWVFNVNTNVSLQIDVQGMRFCITLCESRLKYLRLELHHSLARRAPGTHYAI